MHSVHLIRLNIQLDVQIGKSGLEQFVEELARDVFESVAPQREEEEHVVLAEGVTDGHQTLHADAVVAKSQLLQ
jgi:hypothetical protein